MAFSFLVMLLEMSTRLIKTSTFLQLMSILHTINAITALFTGYCTDGASLFAILIVYHTPYFVSLLRMYIEIGSEKRR